MTDLSSVKNEDMKKGKKKNAIHMSYSLLDYGGNSENVKEFPRTLH